MSLRLIRRPGSRLWQIAGTVAGQRIRESAGTADREVAEERRAAREAELHRGAIYGPAAIRTWGEAMLRYDQTRAPRPGQAALLARITRHFGPKLLLKDIDQDRVDEAVRALCAPDAAPATKLRNVIGPVRAVLTAAARRGWCKVPTFEVPAGATGVKRTRWLTPGEFARLHDAAAPHLQPLLTFLVCTGARLGEALALDWADVDLAHGRALLRETKNGTDRPIDLPPAAVAAMARLAYPVPNARGWPRRDADGRPMITTERVGRVFRTQRGTGYPASDNGGGQIATAWATACRLAGFAGAWRGGERTGRDRWWAPADVTPHVLRHTWASWRYAVHRDVLRLKAEGGWSSVALVERYAKLVPAGLVPGIMATWGVSSGTPLTQYSGGAA